MVKNEAGEFHDLSFTTCFLTSEKHSFGVHTDKSPKICTHVEQLFLYKAGLLLNINVVVPFLESKNIAKNCVSIQCTPHCQGVSVSQCTWKTSMIHETFVRWALYIVFKFVKSLIRHLGLATGNVRCVWWFSWTLVSPTNRMPAFILIDSPQCPTRATWRHWLANVPHKCTLVRFFCKVNNFELMKNFLTDALSVI